MFVTLLRSAAIITTVVLATMLIDTGSLLLNILIKGVIAVLVSVVMLVVTSFRSKYFKSTVNLIKSFCMSIIGRKKA